MKTEITYECKTCRARWTRTVSQRGFQALTRAFLAICPGCREE